MEIDASKLLENAIKDGLREAVKSRFTASYNNPLDALITNALREQAVSLHTLITEAIRACVADNGFRLAIADGVRSQLCKTLVQRFGGELEKQVNQLKSDPAMRARITLAIEEIVKDRSLATA